MEMSNIHVLLIEDNPDDAVQIQRYLNLSPSVRYNVIRAGALREGLESLKPVRFDVILLDLDLPDAPRGIRTFEVVHKAVPHIPIIVLTGNDDDELAVEAVHKGAQDYLVKGLATGMSLGRAIRYAIERKNMLSQLERSLQEIKQLKETHPDCANCKLVGTHRAPGKK